MKKSNGTDICLNGDQLDMILSSAPVVPMITPVIIPDSNTGSIENQSGTTTIDSGSVSPPIEPEVITHSGSITDSGSISNSGSLDSYSESSHPFFYIINSSID